MSDHEDLQDLLDAAINGPKRSRSANLVEREIIAYAGALNVREGENSIPLEYIYRTYRDWSNKPAPIGTFRKFFKKLFKERWAGKQRYYKLEADSFQLPDFYSYFRDPRYNRKGGNYKVKDCTVKYLGVWKQGVRRFIARLLLPTGMYLPLGTYTTKFEAAHSYDEAALMVYGKDAVLNFPSKWRMVLNGEKDVPLIYRRKKNRRWYNDSIKKAKSEKKHYEELLKTLSGQTENSTSQGALASVKL
jgi:hypothetical protein